jgi:exodeoxyribonuclease-5
LAKHIAEAAGGRVYFAAYTGKAALVLLQAGCVNVSTIHKLIYSPKEKSQQRLKALEADRAKLLTRSPPPREEVERVDRAIQAERQNLSRPSFQLNTESPLKGASLLIVDEYSMIDQQMGEDLLSFGCPVLALGDPGQLPPVSGKPFFTGPPEVMLTEIHRQAKDNPIIWMSREIREGRELKPGRYGESLVVGRSDIPREELQKRALGADQQLVGRNATRGAVNRRTRELLGRKSVFPEKGDKLVCLRNNHDLGILNGQLWAAREAAVEDGCGKLCLRLEGVDGARIEVLAHSDYFRGGQPDYWGKKDAEEFDYGYALTVHKSQGSQWRDVLLFDEWRRADRKEWLYTAVTRASEKISIILM